MTLNASRRAFLQRASALSLAGTAAPWAINLAAMGEAAAQSATDYKALVCVFLYGGNDYGNTLIPVDGASYSRLCGDAADAGLQRRSAGADDACAERRAARRPPVRACARARAAACPTSSPASSA